MGATSQCQDPGAVFRGGPLGAAPGRSAPSAGAPELGPPSPEGLRLPAPGSLGPESLRPVPSRARPLPETLGADAPRVAGRGAVRAGASPDGPWEGVSLAGPRPSTCRSRASSCRRFPGGGGVDGGGARCRSRRRSSSCRSRRRPGARCGGSRSPRSSRRASSLSSTCSCSRTQAGASADPGPRGSRGRRRDPRSALRGP